MKGNAFDDARECWGRSAKQARLFGSQKNLVRRVKSPLEKPMPRVLFKPTLHVKLRLAISSVMMMVG